MNTVVYQLPDEKSLVLRSCEPNLTSYNNFQWPDAGPVTCPDWKPTTNCGNGLHGWLWATGDFSLQVNHPKAKWLAVEVNTADIIDLGGKVKFPSGTVIVCGTFRQAYDLVMKWFWLREATNVASTTGVYAHASTTGVYAHASTTGVYAHASTTGDDAHASTTGGRAHASTTGGRAHASTTGGRAHASTTGKNSIACALGLNSRAMCGELGSVILTYWDGNRYRHVVGYAGENGIEAGKWYALNEDHQLVETTEL